MDSTFLLSGFLPWRGGLLACLAVAGCCVAGDPPTWTDPGVVRVQSGERFVLDLGVYVGGVRPDAVNFILSSSEEGWARVEDRRLVLEPPVGTPPGRRTLSAEVADRCGDAVVATLAVDVVAPMEAGSPPSE